MLERRLKDSRELPANWMDPASPGHAWSRAADATQRCAAALSANSPAHWHARGGWVRAPALVAAMLAAPGITWRGNAAVAALRLERPQPESGTADSQGWTALAADGTVLAQAPLVVVAAGFDSLDLLASTGAPALPLNPLRGQLLWGPMPAPPHPLPPFPVNGLGNFITGVPVDGTPSWVLGSTFERGCREAVLRDADTDEVAAKLAVLLSASAAALAPQIASGAARAGRSAVHRARPPARGRRARSQRPAGPVRQHRHGRARHDPGGAVRRAAGRATRRRAAGRAFATGARAGAVTAAAARMKTPETIARNDRLTLGWRQKRLKIFTPKAIVCSRGLATTASPRGGCAWAQASLLRRMPGSSAKNCGLSEAIGAREFLDLGRRGVHLEPHDLGDLQRLPEQLADVLKVRQHGLGIGVALAAVRRIAIEGKRVVHASRLSAGALHELGAERLEGRELALPAPRSRAPACNTYQA